MENKNSKVIALVALVVAVVGLGVGFAAFSSTLTISSSATVTPNANTFKVLLSNSQTAVASGNVTGTASTGATAGTATVSADTLKITGLKANFTAPNQTVSYTFYAHNTGEYIAYLTQVTGIAKANCVAKAGGGATPGLVTAACNHITIKVSVGATEFTASNTAIKSHSLAKGAKETVVVTITYAETTDRVDGPVDVSFGDITLKYSSVDNA